MLKIVSVVALAPLCAGVYIQGMNICIAKHEAFFAQYSQSFCEKIDNPAMLQLKILHTEHVVRHVRTLLCEETCLAPHAKACLLAALYHDIGRFEQFLRYKTFKDTQSVNHALLGAKVLKRSGILHGEDKVLQRQVIAAVAMHNRFAVPQGVAKDVRLITHAVRDADKLDILRVMAEQFRPVLPGEVRDGAVTFYAQDAPLLWSEPMYEDIMQNRLASYANIVYINDFKLLLGSWVHDMCFTSSKRIMLQAGNLQSILSTLPEDPAMERAKAHILGLLQAVQR